MIGATIHTDVSIQGESQTMRCYLWLKNHVVARLKGPFLARAADCDDIIDTYTINRDAAGIREAQRAKESWLKKAEAVWGNEPGFGELQKLIEIEKQQAAISRELQTAGIGLDEALRLEKTRQEKECRAVLARLEPEATKLADKWREGMRKLRIPVNSSDAEMIACGWKK